MIEKNITSRENSPHDWRSLADVVFMHGAVIHTSRRRSSPYDYLRHAVSKIIQAHINAGRIPTLRQIKLEIEEKHHKAISLGALHGRVRAWKLHIFLRGKL